MENQLFLYLIFSNNYFKFGIAKNMNDRLKAYKTHNPNFNVFALWIGEYNDVKSIEKDILNFFKLHKIKNTDWIQGSPFSNTTTFKVIYDIISRKKISTIFISGDDIEMKNNQNHDVLKMNIDDVFFGDVEIKIKSKPIHFSKRKKINPILNNEYYVSFDGKYATPCLFIGDDKGMAKVRLKCRILGYNHVGCNIVFYDEIGETPNESGKNCVTM